MEGEREKEEEEEEEGGSGSGGVGSDGAEPVLAPLSSNVSGSSVGGSMHTNSGLVTVIREGL